MFGLIVGCTVVGAPTCILVSQRNSDELRTERLANESGGRVGYLPSYVMDLAESKAFQRLEASYYSSNLLLGLSHRRGLQEPNFFSSTSYRLAYSFDWRHVRPAIGLGMRKNVNARSGNAVELWLPVFANLSKIGLEEIAWYFETLWIFGSDGLRPEFQIRMEFPVGPKLKIAGGFGYFADYENPELEVSVGPILDF